MEVFVIRHTSVDVPEMTFYGRTDVALKPTFEQEAAEVRHKIDGISFDKVYTSPLSRAWKLADFCGYPDAEREERIIETSYGEWEMKRFDTITDPQLLVWYNDWIDNGPTGGESYMDQYRRVASFLDELKTKPFKKVALFSHGGVIMCAAVYAGLMKPEEFKPILYPYGHVLKIEI